MEGQNVLRLGMNKNKAAADRNIKVSVVIPFYSHAGWLDEALKSACSQTYRPYEIIVVNDGSKEDITRLEKKYKNEVIFVRQKNQGAAAARNHGIDIAKGDIIAFLDADDIWKPVKLEKQIRFMAENSYVWSVTAFETFGAKRREYVAPYGYDGLCWEHLYNSCRIGTPAAAVCRKVLKDSRFAPDMKTGQDTFLWLKLSCQYQLGVLNEPLVKVRMRKGSASKRLDVHIRNRAVLWEKMSVTHELREPERALTRAGYKICWHIWKKEPDVKVSIKNKILFAAAWTMFRFDNCLLDMKNEKRRK